MPKEPTEKSKYLSKYSPGKYVTCKQFLIETVCENRARYLKMGDLPVQFWKLPEWAKYYASQTRECSKLCKQYGEIPLLRTLTKHPKGRYCTSFWSKKLLEYLKDESIIYQKELEQMPNNVVHERNENIKSQEKVSNNKLLKELD